MVVIVDLADRKGNLGVEYMRKMGEEGREGACCRIVTISNTWFRETLSAHLSVHKVYYSCWEETDLEGERTI